MKEGFINYQNIKNSKEIIDFSKIKKTGENSQTLSSETRELTLKTLNTLEASRWLPAIAEQYKISPNLEDYICIPVIIMPSDLPNRNGVAFPYDELVAFNPDPNVKRIGYKTWEYAPCFEEHANSRVEEAKGVVFASSLLPIKNSVGDLFKVVCLCGFDRTKDEVLYNKIKSGERNTYSMGAYCQDYECSICGKLYTEGGCEHVDLNNPQFKLYDTKEGPKLAYYNALQICGFEVSSVSTPAYISAQNTLLL